VGLFTSDNHISYSSATQVATLLAFSPQDQYVMKHVMTGKSTILDNDQEFVVLHKDRYVIGVTIFITKLSGFGMDSIFMGMFGVRFMTWGPLVDWWTGG
jgi:hypothetical protein